MKRAFDTEILCVGTEILLGHITNTDARDISELLAEIGINVKYHTVVGDNPERLRQCVEIAKGRADILITTGGLGPTCDDLTKQTVCAALGIEMYYDERAEAELRAYFRVGKGGSMTDNNLQQCYLPVGCTPFYNTCGTAPGCGFTAPDGTHVLILPGPPKELNAMMAHGGTDFLRTLSDEHIVSRNIMTFGMGESTIERMLRDSYDLTAPRRRKKYTDEF